MRLNPHGDSAIYETLVRLTRGNETLLHPFIDSKGSFGKHYSSEMVYAAHVIQNASLIHFALKYSEESTEMRSICAKIMTALC